ncbi:hypothetical protein [Hymenobacter sp. BT190]|uniref:hypothetical protein n=1 Tax=Hymenobacter sp. BT190 TaxID=2763505 RepID=UPI00165188C4|nr:hypothetical protein [Hymenobacter sp. BT190]MBC6699860.1 hypothetical protein [Hymenobacter sp. BT190]
MLQKLLTGSTCVFIWALLLGAQPALAQKPLLYLHLAKPGGPLLVSIVKDSASVLDPLRQKLQANGYQVVTNPDTLRKSLGHSPNRPFLYADVVCFQIAGSNPTVIFAVRDTLNKPWFTASEVVRMFVSPQKAYGSAAEYLAKKLPIAFTPRFGHAAATNQGPQFMSYDNFQFINYLEPALLMSPLRQQLKKGDTVKLTIHVDELGVATLQNAESQVPLDAAIRRALDQAVQDTPPWGPALINGRRTASDFQLTVGRGNKLKPVQEP